MMYRAVIYTIDHGINIVWLKTAGNWFSFRGRSYRKDSDATCQVMQKGNRIRGLVEAVYMEGNPLPLRSKLSAGVATMEHWNSLLSKSGNKPAVNGLLAKFGKGE